MRGRPGGRSARPRALPRCRQAGESSGWKAPSPRRPGVTAAPPLRATRRGALSRISSMEPKLPSASDGSTRARLRTVVRADRAIAGRTPRRVAAAGLHAGHRCSRPPRVQRPAAPAAVRRAVRRQRHPCGRSADPDRAAAWGGAAAGAGRRRRVGGARAAHAAAAGRQALRRGRAARAPRRGPLACAPARRAGRACPAAAVHHRAARRRRALPDRLRAGARLGRRADGGAPLHAGAARRAATSSA